MRLNLRREVALAALLVGAVGCQKKAVVADVSLGVVASGEWAGRRIAFRARAMGVSRRGGETHLAVHAPPVVGDCRVRAASVALVEGLSADAPEEVRVVGTVEGVKRSLVSLGDCEVERKQGE